MKKHLSFCIIFILLATSAHAQETDRGIDKQDYKNADFLRSSDPATWSWSEVDFSNPAVYQNPKLYSSSQFSANFHNVPPVLYGMVKFYQLDFNLLQYGSLKDKFYQHPAFASNLKRVPASKYNEVKWEGVDFQKIRFNDVDWNAQLPPSFHQTLAQNQNGLNSYCREQSKGTCNIHVDSGEVGNVIFTGKGMILGEYGVELKHYPSGTRYEVVDGRIVVQIVAGQVALPARLGSDVVRIVATRDLIIAFPNAKQGELKTVQGTLEYNNGEWSVPSKSSAIINKVEITTFDDKTIIHGLDGKSSAFSDFEPKPGEQSEKLQDMHASFDKNIIYFGKEKILAVGSRCDSCPLSTKTVTLDFQPGNPYITIKEGGESLYEQAHDDRLTITPISGGAVWNGKDELIISGRVRMQNGVQEIIFNNGGVYAKAVLEHEDSLFFDSVPMTVRFFDELMNDPYLDEHKQRLRDEQGKLIENSIQIHEDNYIEFGNVEYFALEVDPHHLLIDTETGFKLVNNIARFTQPVIIAETPIKKPEEQPYFDAAAQILKENIKGLPVIARLRNPEDLTSVEGRQVFDANSQFLEAIEFEAAQSKLARRGGISSEQVIIGHNEMRGSGIAYVTPTKETTQDFVCFEKLIGCSLGDIKLREISYDVLDMALRGYIESDKGITYPPVLREGKNVVENRVIDGDICLPPVCNPPIINRDAYREIDILATKRMTQPDVTSLYDGTYDYGEHVAMLGIHPNKAPIHAAIRAVQLNYPKFQNAKAKDILLSPEMRSIEFPCGFAKEASLFASNATEQIIQYKEKKCR